MPLYTGNTTIEEAGRDMTRLLRELIDGVGYVDNVHWIEERDGRVHVCGWELTVRFESESLETFDSVDQALGEFPRARMKRPTTF